MSRPVSTKVISLRKPPSVFSPTFNVGGGGSPQHARDAHAVDAVRRELDGVEAGGDIRSGVAGAADLVQQLCGHGADGDGAAGLIVLGDDRRAVLVQFGDRETGMAGVGDLVEERVVAARWPAGRTR